MDWRDQGTCLSVRRHGETAAIIEVFTEHHGRHAGVVRGGASRKMAAVLQPGNRLDVEWRARLDAHIGTYRVEPLQLRAGPLLSDRAALAALNSVTALLSMALPEREANPRLYNATEGFLESLSGAPGWQGHYLAWELLLLEDLGFGLDLAVCAVTGSRTELDYVSPKSGRAVSRAGAGDWAERLLAYPDPRAPSKGLRTTGYFLEHRLAHAHGRDALPEARARLMAIMERAEQRGRE
jgi:DNA repair protein RecO (recombination protein O)